MSIPLGGRDERVTRRDAVANALLHRYSPTLFQLDDSARQYRGMSLLELARESLTNAGVNTRGLSRDEEATRSLHSTSDFPEILETATWASVLSVGKPPSISQFGVSAWMTPASQRRQA